MRSLAPTRWTGWLLAIVSLMVLVEGCALDPLGGGPGLFGRSRSQDVVGRMQTHRIRGDESLIDLARRYDLGYAELVAANPGVDPWVPGQGTRILLPTAHLVPPGLRQGIVVNLAEQRLYVFPASGAAGSGADDSKSGRASSWVRSFPIGVSREGWSTPLGATRVKRKRANPTWYPTLSARREDPTLPDMVGAGPENPLGTHALYLGWPRYLIHGTNEPDGVGRRVSRGCIRLYPEDIVRLFEVAPLETPVRVIHEPVKLARVGNDVFLEVHPNLDDLAQLEEKGRLEPLRPENRPPKLRPRIRAFAGAASSRIDWRLVYQTATERRGVPVRISY